MKLYEFSGLARSGHHAMINWCIKNYCGIELPMSGKFQVIYDRYLWYINEGNLDLPLISDFFNQSKRIEHLFIGYEDSLPNFSFFSPNRSYTAPYDFCHPDVQYPSLRRRIIFIRNFYDNLASRLKKNETGFVNNAGKSIQFDTSSYFINLWKLSAKEILDKKCFFLKFEDWINSPKIRKEFLYDVFDAFENWTSLEVKGTVSSFDEGDKKYLLNRASQVNFPDDVKLLVNSDTELKELIRELGYEVKVI